MLPFGLHQAVEYLLAAALVASALHSPGTAMGVLAAAGGLFAALAATAGPPLGAWGLLGRTAHRRADLVVAALAALSPLLPGRTTLSILVAEAVAVVAWRLERSTRYDRIPLARSPRGDRAHEIGDIKASAPGPHGSASARALGRAVGRGRRSAEAATEAAAEALPDRARRAGVVAGRLGARWAERRRRP